MGGLLATVTGGAIWGVGFAIGVGVVRAAGDGLRPVIRSAMKGAPTATAFVERAAAEGRETVIDLYHEAKVEDERETAHPTAA